MGKDCCLLCGRLTEHLFCSSCSEEGADQFQAIQNHIQKYPGLTIIQLCHELSIPLKIVNALVSRGYVNMRKPVTAPDQPANKQMGSSFHSTKK